MARARRVYYISVTGRYILEVEGDMILRAWEAADVALSSYLPMSQTREAYGPFSEVSQYYREQISYEELLAKLL